MNDDIKRIVTIVTMVIGIVSVWMCIIVVGYFTHVLIKIFMFGYYLIK